MKRIYIVYECDEHRALHSYCIKFMGTNRRIANKVYKRMSSSFSDDDIWSLNLALYLSTPDIAFGDSNALREFDLIETTES